MKPRRIKVPTFSLTPTGDEKRSTPEWNIIMEWLGWPDPGVYELTLVCPDCDGDELVHSYGPDGEPMGVPCSSCSEEARIERAAEILRDDSYELTSVWDEDVTPYKDLARRVVAAWRGTDE